MKISVVIPVYNVEKYLNLCLESIVNQSYYNLEIILVNDGSTDASGAICEEYALKDGRVKVFHQSNQGVSVARNLGVKISTGEFISFVDSDDWIDFNMYDTMVNQLYEHERIDLIMCDTTLISRENKIQTTEKIRSGLYTKSDIISDLYPEIIVTEQFGKIPIVSACSCLIRREILIGNDICFDASLRYSEDYLFMANVVLCASSFYYAKGFHFYNYRQYEESRSKLLQNDWWTNLLSLNEKLRNLLQRNEDYNFERQLKLQLIHSAFFLTGSVVKNSNMTQREKLWKLRELFKDEHLKEAFSDLPFSKQSIQSKVVLFLMKNQMALGYLLYRKLVSKIKFFCRQLLKIELG